MRLDLTDREGFVDKYVGSQTELLTRLFFKICFKNLQNRTFLASSPHSKKKLIFRCIP